MINTEEIKENTGLPGEWKEVKVICPHCTSDNFVYIYDDQETCYCVQCDEEFDLSDIVPVVGTRQIHSFDSLEDRAIQERLEEMVSDDPEVVKELANRLIDADDLKKELKGVQGTTETKQLPAYQHKNWNDDHDWRKDYTGYTGNYNTSFTSCTHTPQHIIDGKTWGVWAGKKEDCRRFAKDYDVVMNLTFLTIKEPHVIPIPELEEFAEVDCNFKEIQLDWPDYGVIHMPREFWEKLLEYLEKNKLKMLVFCQGGHGRTGTALAVMMGLALGYTSDQAINWLHRYYCVSAVETLGQENYVKEMLREEVKNDHSMTMKYLEAMKKKEDEKKDESPEKVTHLNLK